MPPATLAEFNMPAGGQDFYDISLVDGFNLPMSITPIGGSGCRQLNCLNNINDACPAELKVKWDQWTVGCKGPCVAFGKPEFCCTGPHDRAETCPPSHYSRIFKDRCPEAYSYPYDDKSSLASCFNGPDYEVKFCP